MKAHFQFSIASFLLVERLEQSNSSTHFESKIVNFVSFCKIITLKSLRFNK